MSWGRSTSKTETGFVSTAMKDCLAKAITSKEAPVKAKYIREILALTVTEKGAAGFWNWMEGKQNTQNYIICWKFCYILHKIFNEGNPSVITESKARVDFLTSFSKLWNEEIKAPKGNYDTLISYYTGVLVVKLKFHLQNPCIRVDLEMTEQDFYKMLDACHNTGKDLKQLCSELMLYWDFVLAFLTTMHLMIPDTSESSSVQCKLQPLSICFNECICLYTLTKSILIQLSADVEPAYIQPFKLKFENLFRRMQDYKKNTEKWPKDSSMKNIDLPENPPAFEMVHSPKYCTISREHFHGTLGNDDGGHNTANTNIPATAPVGIGNNGGILNHRNSFPSPAPPPPPPNYSILNDQLLLREYRIRELEEENKILSQKVEYLESSRNKTQQAVENLTSPTNDKVEGLTEVERLKEELKQLKINSGQQFLQLHAKIREKDEILSQMQVEKNQYELLAQMNLERMQMEFQQQNAHSENSQNLQRRYKEGDGMQFAS